MKKLPQFDFYKNRNKYFLISGVIFAIALVVALIFGVKTDIKFTGGTMTTYSYTGSIDNNAFKNVIEGEVDGLVTVTSSVSVATGESNLAVNISGKGGLLIDEQSALLQKLQEAFPDNNIETVATSNVSATMGKDFLLKSLMAVLIAAILMIIYIGFRFQKIGGISAGICAVIALLHDLLMVLATFIIGRMSLDSNFIAVLLVILGYSINATIVVYDRIRENRKLYGNTLELAEVMNKSVNQTLSRTINTTISTMIAMVAIAVMAVIFQVNSIITFAIPLIIGLIAGTYSSTCISGCLWVLWQEKRIANLKKR